MKPLVILNFNGEALTAEAANGMKEYLKQYSDYAEFLIVNNCAVTVIDGKDEKTVMSPEMFFTTYNERRETLGLDKENTDI